ncbi:MAG: glycosyltransferase [Alphaproteobacteria bacterium]|nr:glycosyltransferase [Alphaproteobacteria bacterium]
MRVSYVATFYNKERFVPFVLASIAAQEGPFEKECIFIDDGSTDRTVEALRQGCGLWPNVTILTQDNAGPARALNRGLALASGDIVKPIDGDDILAPTMTSAGIEAMRRYGVGIVFARRFLSYDPGTDDPNSALSRFQPIAGEAEKIDAPLDQTIRRSTINPTGWMARRSIVERAGSCDPDVFIQDYSIELRLAAAGPLADLSAPAWAYPVEAPGRLTDNKAQILHDVNLAALRFLRSRPDLRRDYLNLAMRRAARRALAWEQRHGSLVRVPYLQWLYARSLLGLLRPTEAVEAALCAPFRATGRVRLASASQTV